LAQEIDSIDRRPEVFRHSALIAVVAPRAREARIALLEVAGRKLVSRLAQERAELRELLGQPLRLSYEIAGREKELAASPDSGLTATQHREPKQVDDDEELWPFQGEYWRDELGSYRYQLGTRCRKPRERIQTAQDPAAPSQVAGEAKPWCVQVDRRSSFTEVVHARALDRRCRGAAGPRPEPLAPARPA